MRRLLFFRWFILVYCYSLYNEILVMRVFKLYNGKQKIDYRKIRRWRIRVNVANKIYKNFEFD